VGELQVLRAPRSTGAVAAASVETWPPEHQRRGLVPVLQVLPETGRYDRSRRWKRVLDVSFVVLALPLALPLAAVIAVAVVLCSPGSPMFGHERLGQSGRTFKCLKFRTMHRDAEERLRRDAGLYERYVANDFKLPAEADPRIFAFGRFLRKASLDEIPQLLNVLRGEMSLVGPRPIVPAELAQYGPWQGAYLAMLPGVTGPWQATGRNNVRYPERARLDAEYLEQWSFAGDLRILAKTVPSTLRRTGCD
jgi:exopolysaccharide production protein ExoY